MQGGIKNKGGHSAPPFLVLAEPPKVQPYTACAASNQAAVSASAWYTRNYIAMHIGLSFGQRSARASMAAALLLGLRTMRKRLNVDSR